MQKLETVLGSWVTGPPAQADTCFSLPSFSFPWPSAGAGDEVTRFQLGSSEDKCHQYGREVGLGTLTFPVPHTLEVALQQDSGASAHLELWAWIPSQRRRDKLKCRTEPTAALWWSLGRSMWEGAGHRQTHTQARRRPNASSRSELLTCAVPGRGV